MSLIISLRKGDDFFVNDERVVVSEIVGPNNYTLHVTSTGKKYRITDQEAKEVMPSVFVSSGGFLKWGQVRLVIDAPKDILILRGERYREAAE